MTQDEIIRMAREAGFEYAVDNERWYRFAALVAEPWIETNKALAKEIIELKKQAEQEREACAKVCDGWPDYDVQGLAETIRARSK